MEVIRMDLILSYWLFFWWILYQCGMIAQNPKFFLIIGLITNLIMLLRKIMNKSRTVLPFVIINMVIKVLPLIMLRNTKITYQDLEASLIVAMIYMIWVLFNIETVLRNTKSKARPPFENWWVNHYRQ